MSIELHLFDSNCRYLPVVRRVEEEGLLGVEYCLGRCGIVSSGDGRLGPFLLV